MLTIGLSLNSGIKLLERALVAPLRGINKKLQEIAYSLSPVAVAAEVSVVVEVQAPKLRIAKTTLPDQCLDFNHTFQHIRYELDLLYKQQNPMFTNTILPLEPSTAQAKTDQPQGKPTNEPIGKTLATNDRAPRASEAVLAHQALHVAKTTLPDERLDFNQTFLHIRYGLNGFYGRQHLN